MKHISTRQLALCAVLTALALGLSTLENLFPVTLLDPPARREAGPCQHRHRVRPVSAGRSPGAGHPHGPVPAGRSLRRKRLRHALFPAGGPHRHAGDDRSCAACRCLSIYGVSIGGAAGHNLGQMARCACITLGNTAVLVYLPFLLAHRPADGNPHGLRLLSAVPGHGPYQTSRQRSNRQWIKKTRSSSSSWRSSAP